MGLIAARLILALSVIAAHTAPVLADGSSASNATEPGAFALPAFVPKARQANYATAVNDTNSAVGARRAAEELSAKFADVTTNSISRDEAAAEISPQTAQPAVHRPRGEPSGRSKIGDGLASAPFATEACSEIRDKGRYAQR